MPVPLVCRVQSVHTTTVQVGEAGEYEKGESSTHSSEPPSKVKKFTGRDKLILEISADELIDVTAPLAKRSNFGTRTQTLWLASILISTKWQYLDQLSRESDSR